MPRFNLWIALCTCCFLTVGVAEANEQKFADVALERVRAATTLLDSVSMKSKIVVVKGAIPDRPIVLAAWDPRTGGLRIIDLTIPSKYQREFPVKVQTPGCSIEHLTGYGPIRFAARVFCDDKELTVYRAKHVVFKDGTRPYQKGGAARALPTMEEVSYTPYYDRLRDPSLTERGAEFIANRITLALADLRLHEVKSVAVPDKLLADTIPYELISALGVIEQSDVDAFDADPEGTIEGVLTHFALNGDDAFKLARSSANARGAYQFTNKNGNGTYSLVVRKCQGANLNPNFLVGAADLHNVIKAAACLIDFEMAAFPELRDAYVLDPLYTGMYAVAAYNGGHFAASKFHEWRVKQGIEIADLTPELLPVSFARNTETPKYVQKYLHVISKAIGIINVRK